MSNELDLNHAYMGMSFNIALLRLFTLSCLSLLLGSLMVISCEMKGVVKIRTRVCIFVREEQWAANMKPCLIMVKVSAKSILNRKSEKRERVKIKNKK